MYSESVAPPGDERTTSDLPADSFDEVLRRVVATPAAMHLEPGTVLDERFRIERLVGVGGMGAVYLAHDQTLVRDVAIKIHHVAAGSARLRREAVAMARLAHPNVVTVYEVGELDGHPFVAMEYVTGATLRAWLAERPRSVPEKLALLRAAGQGLAAAHDAGLVHRDFKPENVLVGSDGRARVGDFGLARDVDAETETSEGGSDLANASLTQTGAVIGTPAYMAPEQLAGVATVDARADQFAFCITAWEALWSERPFAGGSAKELASAMERGERRAPPPQPAVPAEVRAALERGLAVAASERFPSMHELLAALSPAVRVRRRVVLTAAALVLAGGAGAWFASRRSEPVVSCDDAGAQAIALVPRDLPKKLRAVGATSAAELVERAVTELVANLASGARTACEAGRQRREWSPEVLAKSDACFEVAARSARYLLDVATVSPTNRDELVGRATSLLPDPSGCTSPTFLSASPPLPADLGRLEATIEALVDRDTAYGEIVDGRTERARPHVEKLARSPVRDDPRIAMGRALLDGVLASVRGQDAVAEKKLSDTYYAARAIDDDQALVWSLLPLLKLAIEKPITDPFVAMWLRAAGADAERLAHRAPWLSARLYLAMAHVADANGDAEAALRDVARVRDLAPARSSLVDAAAAVEGAVLIWSGRVDEGSAIYERAVARESERIGAQHPRVGTLLSDYAVLLLGATRPERALEVAKQALAIVEVAADPDDRLLDNVRVNLAAVLADDGTHDDRVQARALLEVARAHYVAEGGEQSSWVANIDMNIASSYLAEEDPVPAIPRLESALATTEQRLGRERIEVAEVLFNLAAAQRMAKRLPEALASAKRSAAIYTQRAGTDRHRMALGMVGALENQLGDPAAALATVESALAFTTPAESAQTPALLQLERGRALVALGRMREARTALEASRASYAAVNMTKRIHEVDALLARTR